MISKACSTSPTSKRRERGKQVGKRLLVNSSKQSAAATRRMVTPSGRRKGRSAPGSRRRRSVEGVVELSLSCQELQHRAIELFRPLQRQPVTAPRKDV